MSPDNSEQHARRRLIWGGLCLALLVTGITLWLTLGLRDRAIKNWQQELSRFATLVAEVAERGLQAIDEAEREILDDVRQRNISDSAELAAYTRPQAFQIVLQKRMGTLPQDESIAIVDANGMMVALSSDWPAPRLDLSQRAYFRHAKTDPTTEPFLAVFEGVYGDLRPTLFLGHRISARDGTFLGVIISRIKTDYFNDLYRSILSDTENTIALTLNDGKLALRYPPAPEFLGKTLGRIVPLATGVNALLDNISPLDGMRRFAAVHALANYPAWITFSVDAASALAPWRKEAVFLGIAAALLDCAILGSVALMLHRMRIQARVAQAERLETEADLRQARERSARQIQSAADRASILSGLATAFDQRVGQMSRAVAEAALQLRSGATSVTGLASNAMRQTHTAATEAAGQAKDVRTMANVMTALTGSIEGVVLEVHRSTALVGEATVAAQEADATVMTLTDSAGHIGQIVKLIGGIAQQTNLLALNATIEAARAGDAGRGFALVASEVKTLSKAVSDATAEIKHQIDGMQVATTQTATAMTEIGTFIATLNAIATEISSAMEQQRIATLRIAGTMVSAADGTQMLAARIDAASTAAAQTGKTATDLRNGAELLADRANVLRTASELYLVQVQAA
jgi:methyl-accepting chemotaxis protein